MSDEIPQDKIENSDVTQPQSPPATSPPPEAQAPLSLASLPPPTPEQIREVIKEIVDPEIGISIVELGLIYGIEVRDHDVYVTATLTSPACPLGEVIKEQVEERSGSMPGVRYVYFELVWEPPWDPKTMCSEEAKLELGIF